ncbi:MAG: acyl-CoA dehydrogenase [Deltaproteobacteria bacterium]|nr:acyl-CoA dehydrogenase [Deltaproteobacteria bacterium]
MSVRSDDDWTRESERLLELVDRIADEVVAVHAERVDRDACFPEESFQALRGAGLLGVMVPSELGGPGCELRVVAEMCSTLARRCASTAMNFAMHQSQVASIVDHRGCVPELDDYLRDLVHEQRLIASVTSEVGVGGDLRRSLAPVELDGDRITFEKAGTTGSYCQHADDFLVSLRRAPDAAESDQVLVLARRGEFDLKGVGDWDTLGMRGTCSPPVTISGAGASWQVLPAPFRVIATRTMVPTSHLLWAAVWYGIASDAFDRARRFVQVSMRKDADAGCSAPTRLAHLADRLGGMRARIEMSLGTYERIEASENAESAVGMAEALELNELKISASTEALEIVNEAFLVVGIASYRNGGEFSLGRHLRDIQSAPLMISNDRIRLSSAELLQVYKGRGRFAGPS